MAPMSVPNRVVAALCLVSLISCNRAGVGVTPATSVAWGPSGARPDTEVVAPLYDFGGDGGKDGTIGNAGGTAGLIGTATELYGATPAGGDLSCTWEYAMEKETGCGVVYKLTPRPGSSSYKETRLHVFTGPPDDGAGPFGTLLMGKNGELYGTTYEGGTNNAGVIFKVNASGSGYSVVYNFAGAPDGAYPFAGVIEVSGVLYGTTLGGGTHQNSACGQLGSAEEHCGTLYGLNEATGVEHVLHNFGAGTDDGITPYDAPTYVNGMLYGTTPLGLGRNASGTVFALSPTTGKERIFPKLSTFAAPIGGVIAVNGILYATALNGGGLNSQGVVFSVEISSGRQHVLHRFIGIPGGIYPEAGLTYRKGRLYSTTVEGGSGTKCGSTACGTIYSLALDGSGFSVLASFSGQRGGSLPEDTPLYSAGSLYGTTLWGGARNQGIAFKLPL